MQGLFLIACSGVVTNPSSSLTPEAKTDSQVIAPNGILGLKLGATEEDIQNLVPVDAKRGEKYGTKFITFEKEWLGKNWTVTILFIGDNTADVLLFYSEGSETKAKEVASSLCSLFNESIYSVVWSAAPDIRYTMPFQEGIQYNTMLGCYSKNSQEVYLAGTDSLTTVVTAFNKVAIDGLVKSDDQEKNANMQVLKSLTEKLENAFTPFDWRSSKHVGDNIPLGNYQYVIQSIVLADHVGKNPYLRKKASENATFLLVKYTIENTSNETAAVMANDLNIRDTKGRSFRPSTAATQAFALDSEIDLMLSELQPGIPKKQTAVFEVPSSELHRLDLVIPEKGLGGSGEVVLPLTFTDVMK